MLHKKNNKNKKNELDKYQKQEANISPFKRGTV